MRKKIVFCLTCIFITLLMAEISFQIIHLKANSKIIRKTFLERLLSYTEPPYSWENYFLTIYEKNATGIIPVTGRDGMHGFHPTRGWSLKPNVSIMRRGKTYTTNSDGYRSLYEFKFDPTRYSVLIVGDSFTFGDNIDDIDTWPYLLQQMDMKLNVFNLAGSGYGIDQMYITLKESINRYRPKLIIASFIDNDLYRSLLYFRDYKKPRFVLNEEEELVLTNTPIGDISEVVSEISQKQSYFHSPLQTVNVFYGVLRKLGLTRHKEEPHRSNVLGGCSGECNKLNTKLFEKMSEIAKKNKADLLILYLPYGKEIFDRGFKSYGNYFYNKYRESHKNFFLNPREDLIALNQKSRGHYKRAENEVVSRQVYKEIQHIQSWIDFNKNQDQQ